jgi:hypothetical protein
MPFSLSLLRADFNEQFEKLRDKDGLYGAYRGGARKRPDLYASLDVAVTRALMGENLLALPETHRCEWADHINSFARTFHGRAPDGGYYDTFGHSDLHCNGMVIGALGVIGGKQRFPCRLYDPFKEIRDVATWLEKIDWAEQWSASHLFWGGMHCFSFSRECTPEWLETVFAWLDRNLDHQTGWWRAGVPHADRHQPLGGSVHIIPIYEHHARRFPVPERVIDSVLALQLDNGQWLHGRSNPFTYLELDALYAYALMRTWAPGYRKGDIAASVTKYGKAAVKYMNEKRKDLLTWHPHLILAAAGALGLLQQLDPENFVDSNKWTNIFGDKRFYQTAAVEVFDAK